MGLIVVINRPSNSARTLAEQLECKRVRPDRVNRNRRGRVCINWGTSGAIASRNDQRILNVPDAVAKAKDKRRAFAVMQNSGVPIPSFWTRREDAQQHRRGREIILARSSVTGSGGRGITIIRPGEALPDVPLYVKYISKKREYRVHVVNGQVIFVQQKRRRNDIDQTPDQKLIRNHANGWVFAENSVSFLNDTERQEMESACISAVRACGLDFGAVDVIINTQGHPVVLEINTAPGLESTALIEAYRAAFTEAGGSATSG